MGLFDKEVGGSILGNFLRDTANKISPMLGNGEYKINQKQYDFINLSDNQYLQKYGITKNGQIVAGTILQPNIKDKNQMFDYLGHDISLKAKLKLTWAVIKQYPLTMSIIVGLFSLLLFFSKQYFKKHK